MLKRLLLSLALVIGFAAPAFAAGSVGDTFSVNEIVDTGGKFFGSVSQGLASVVEKAVSQFGLPNGYILGEEGSAAIFIGARYGEGGAATWDELRKALVAHEDARSWGYGAEIAARIADELFEHLDAPVRRIGALDTFVGYHPQLEDAILPQPSDLAQAMRELKRY